MWILIAVLLLLSLAAIGQVLRNRDLDAWARSVPLTESQQDAMRRLWSVFRQGIVPDLDPLASLSQEDLAHVLEVCGEAYRPQRFGKSKGLRIAQFQSLLERGYSPDQAAVVVGMTVNRVGREDSESR